MASNRPSGRRRRRLSAVLLLVLALMSGALALPYLHPVGADVSGAPDTAGTDFWLAFPQNYTQTPTLTLFVTGSSATSGSAVVGGATIPFTVTPGAVTSVPIPASAQLSVGAGVENKGIHVTALDDVTVYGLNRIQFTTDAYLGLPTDILGTEYFVLGSAPAAGMSSGAVVATQDATTVTITPTAALSTGEPAGTAFDVALNAGQTYEFDSLSGDLSGSLVTATKPIGVYGGNTCANIPDINYGACDHIIEQLPPVTAWGKSFLTVPLATRLNGDTFRLVAAEDDTVVSVNGAPVATLNRGQVHEQIIAGAASVTADKSILLAQYSNGTSYDGVTSDPFEMLVPPTEQYLPSYTVTTPADGFSTNFLNLVVPTDAIASVLVDGVAVPAGDFTPIGSSGFSGAQVSVALGSHTVAASKPLGLFAYGFASFDSYGYPGGSSLAPVATVDSLTLAPATQTLTTGTAGSVVATLQDSNDAPVVGVRVDFSVAGVNPGTGFAFTDTAGQAQFSYTGVAPGSDTITATQGSLSATAAITWTSAPPVNTKPVADAKSVVTDQDTPAGVTLSGSDADGDALTFAVATPPANGTLSGTAPNLTYTPNAGYFGADSFTYTANDGTESSDPATVSITVNEVPPDGCLVTPATVDELVTRDYDKDTRSLVSPKLSTDGERLLVAFIGADGRLGRTQEVTEVSGGGLTWTLASKSNETWGTTEVWYAVAPDAVSNLRVEAELRRAYHGTITVVAFEGSSGIGAVAGASGSQGAPAVTLTPTSCGSSLWASGHDWTNSARPRPVEGQSLAAKFIDRTVNDSYWTSRVDDPTADTTPVTIKVTGPRKDLWTYAAVEILGT